MKLYNCVLFLGGDLGNSVPKECVTASEIILLRHFHGQDAVGEIVPAREDQASPKQIYTYLMGRYGRSEQGSAAILSLFGHPDNPRMILELDEERAIPEEKVVLPPLKKPAPAAAKKAEPEAAPAEPETVPEMSRVDILQKLKGLGVAFKPSISKDAAKALLEDKLAEISGDKDPQPLPEAMEAPEDQE